MRYELKQYFHTSYKNISIFNIASCMNMQCAYMQVGSPDHVFYRRQLANGNTKLTRVVPRRDFDITSCKNIWPDTDTYRVRMTEFFSKFFQVCQAVNINMDT